MISKGQIVKALSIANDMAEDLRSERDALEAKIRDWQLAILDRDAMAVEPGWDFLREIMKAPSRGSVGSGQRVTAVSHTLR